MPPTTGSKSADWTVFIYADSDGNRMGVCISHGPAPFKTEVMGLAIGKFCEHLGQPANVGFDQRKPFLWVALDSVAGLTLGSTDDTLFSKPPTEVYKTGISRLSATRKAEYIANIVNGASGPEFLDGGVPDAPDQIIAEARNLAISMEQQMETSLQMVEPPQ